MSAKEEQFINALSVLSESVRYRILSLIASKGELTAKDILEQFDFTQPTLSHHMACLSEAGLVNVERRGRSAYYSINKDTIDLVSSGIDSLKTGSKKSSKAKTPENDDIEKFKKSKKKKKKDKNKKKKKD
ncbi:MAG: winged helix-turn-helix transcriptional regulator [Clostridiales bacterium]|nr:winged helix-turn-helix transcriptional regulator [Clostridiales bacterium]MBR2820728.1 winged helix-turn-helix transcriptional regulator [Clostridiales bacterium]MBR5944697.1 winged helix-turn-helix transcriptional regulator [Lachnospiraceae bacterium]